MKTMSELLREADPLGYEPRRSSLDRHVTRRQVVQAFRPEVVQAFRPAEAVSAVPRPGRRFVIAAATGLALAGIAAGYWSLAVDVVAAVRFDVRLAEDNPAPGLREVVVSAGRRIYLREEAVVTNSDIASARLVEGGTFSIAITFTAEGAAKMSRASGSHVGKPLAILIDGKVVMAPVVRAAITTSAVISGDFTRAEAERIVAGIVGR